MAEKHPTQNSSRIPCQVCGRKFVPLKDGTSRNHYPTARSNRTFRYDRDYCQGSGFRLERWPVYQELRHHSGDRWFVVEDRGGKWGDYFMRCVWGREAGREMVVRGEYMHRRGWTPVIKVAA